MKYMQIELTCTWINFRIGIFFPVQTEQMQIPFYCVFSPNGAQEYMVSSLIAPESESLLVTGISAVTNKILDQPTSPYLGLVHRSASIQLYAYMSSTGWVLMLGLEQGPYDSDEVARSFLDRAYGGVVDAFLNPFFTKLDDSKWFREQTSSCIQSHSVMMTFMASSQVLG
jgi:hypothetical protein